MGPTLSALLNLQSIEKELAQVRRRLKTRKMAVRAQEARIKEAESRLEDVKARISDRRRSSDQYELDLKTREEQVAKYRAQLQHAKTNKEYASILTQINTLKADNAKLEEEGLKAISEVDTLQAEADEVRQRIEAEQAKLEEVRASSAKEIERLEGLLRDLEARREEAAADIPPEPLAMFERISETYDGEAMAEIEVHGKRPPYTFVCGGCFMGLSAEHANALTTRDEIRTCDNCGRILYMSRSRQEQA